MSEQKKMLQSSDKKLLEKYSVDAKKPVPEWIVNEAHLVNEALGKRIITETEANEGLTTEAEIAEMMRQMVAVTYFVEFPPENVSRQERGKALKELFSQKVDDGQGKEITLADYLRNNRQSVSLAMSTLDESTAEAIKFLNEKEVPVVGWITLEDEDGYWTNKTNMIETIDRTEEVLDFAKEHELKLAGVGLDIERPIDYIKALSKYNIKGVVKASRRYRAKVKEAGDPEAAMNWLLHEMREQGVNVEVYAMPRFLKQALGGMKVPEVDKVIEMSYTSTVPRFLQKGGRAMKIMHTPGNIPAFGLITGVDNETPGRDLAENGKLPPHLDQAALTRDMQAVVDIPNRTFALREMYVFALNDAKVAQMTERALRDTFSTAKD